MMLSMALPTFAHDFEIDGIYYNIIDDTAKTVEVTYKGSSLNSYSNEYTGRVTIPSSVTYNGVTYSVASIGSSAFSNCSGLTSVTIGNSVTSIGNWAFSKCTNMTSVTIPNSVTSVGTGAFTDTGWYNNQSEGVLYLDNCCLGYKGSKPIGVLSLKDDTRLIGSSAFSGCDGLTSVTIGNSVTTIGSSAFYNCSGLTSVAIGNSVVSIGSSAFSKCSGLTELTIPNSVTSIGYEAFYSCYGLTSVTIGNSVTEIGTSAFYGCYGLTSVTIPNSVTEIGISAFNRCTGLSSAIIGNSVTTIGSSAFFYCSGLTSVTIPNSVIEIGSSAFYNCSGLTSVAIGNSVASIGSSAFYNCSGLTCVTIPNSVTSIGYGVFRDCSGLTSVIIGNSVSSIGEWAFYGCSGLTEITIPKSVTTIGDEAFQYCYLKTIVSLNSTPPTCADRNLFYDYTNATLYAPKDYFAKYFVDDVWGQFTNIKKIETLVSSITLNETTLSLNSGSDYTLNATASPSNATIPNLTWESDNNSVAIVDQNGKVTGVSAGTATITVRANDGSNVSATCKVTVNSVTTTITLSQTEATLPVNDIMTLSYSITNSATKTATWSTSDANVAYVKPNSDGSATVVGMAVGVATITATVIDNGKEYSASCVVTVGVGGIEGVEADNNAVEVARYDIHGRLITEPTKGVNIIKYSDGTTRKEIVK